MFCSNCGNEVKKDVRFCNKCGNEIAPVSNQAQNVHVSSSIPDDKYLRKQQCISCKGRGRRFSWKFIFSLFLGITVIPSIGLFFGTVLAVPFASVSVIAWGWHSRKCHVCDGSGVISIE